MFTGIIQGQGIVIAAALHGQERRFAIRPQFPMPDITDGESIAVNGVCLSVESHAGDEFTAYASAETLKASTLGSLAKGARVNLERSIKAGERLGGHMVSGHVDCIAEVAQLEKAGESLHVTVRFPADFSAQVVAKGSVALDGISLTVNACRSGFLEVNIIPDSQKRTNISLWRKGSKINLETDIIGKYVQHMLKPWQKLDESFLARHGFM